MFTEPVPQDSKLVISNALYFNGRDVFLLETVHVYWKYIHAFEYVWDVCKAFRNENSIQ